MKVFGWEEGKPFSHKQRGRKGKIQIGLHAYCKNCRSYLLIRCIFCIKISQIKFEVDEMVSISL